MAAARLTDGFSTIIEFGADPTIGGLYMWEKEVTPVGYDGGGMIDITSMRNSVWRTRLSKALVTLTEVTITIAWNPVLYANFLAMLNINQLITITLPDGSTIEFYGWLNSFLPQSHSEGAEPVSTVNIIPSNISAIDGVSEISPVFEQGPS